MLLVVPIVLERAKSSILRTGIFGNFFFGGGNFAFPKREFPVALTGMGFLATGKPSARFQFPNAVFYKL